MLTGRATPLSVGTLSSVTGSSMRSSDWSAPSRSSDWSILTSDCDTSSDWSIGSGDEAGDSTESKPDCVEFPFGSKNLECREVASSFVIYFIKIPNQSGLTFCVFPLGVSWSDSPFK